MPVAGRISVRTLAVLACVALSVAACSSSGSSGGGGSPGSSSSKGGAYNWGINGENSGPLAYYGLSLTAGIKAYVDHVNAAGGINGHKIDLTVLDNAGEQSEAATNATQLATTTNVDAMFGGVLSSDCSAATPVAVRYKVPVGCLSVDQDSPYVYSLGAANQTAASPLFVAAKKVTGKSNPKAAFVYINTLTDIALAKSMGPAAKSAGVDLVTSQELDIAATDVSGAVTKVVDSHPDVMIITHTGPGMLMVLKGIRAAGLNVPVVWLDGTGNLPTLATSTDQNVYPMDITLVPTPDSTGQAAKDYVAGISPTIKGTPTTMTLNSGEALPAYATAQLFGAALKKCGYPCSGAQLNSALQSAQIQLPGIISGNFGYTASNHYPYTNWYLLHQVGSNVSIVDSLPVSS
jgi:branched-chain amino acid transport system substrate-binding protein